VDTVEILLDGRSDITWHTTEMLREIDWGSMTGMKIADVNFKQMAADVETREMLYERAGRVVEWLLENYRGKTLLIVSHGLFLRSLTACLTGVPIDRLHTIMRLDNCESRWISLY
jgi:probable phosphoglycerate mutase